MKAQITQKKSKEYKETKVGVNPIDWEVKSIDDLFFISGGFAASRAQLSDDGFCYLHYGDIHKSKRTYIDIKESFSEIPKLNISVKLIPRNSILNNGDVVFVDASEDDEGASKHIVIYNTDGLTYISGLHTIVLKSKDDSIENIYKQYCFQTISVKEQFRFYTVGTKVTGISKTNIAKISLTYPPKPEQTAIATVLSDTDALIESLEKLITKKKAIKHGTMQQLLTGKKRLPGFSGEWEVKKLGKICEIKKGQLITDRSRIEGNIPVIAGGKVPAYFHNKANRNGKTITISASGASAGYVAYHNYPIFVSDCSSIEESKKYTIEFIYFLLQSKQEKIYKMQTGGAQPHIHPSDLTPINVSMPKKEEQTAIATILSDMDAEITSLEKKRDKYIMLKQGMMQQLLTGRIRIYDNN